MLLNIRIGMRMGDAWEEAGNHLKFLLQRDKVGDSGNIAFRLMAGSRAAAPSCGNSGSGLSAAVCPAGAW